MMLGLRGIQGVQGGVEKHAECLARELVNLGCDIEVITRSSYTPSPAMTSWKGIRIRRIWSPSSKYLEAIVHTLLGVVVAALRRPDILHIHAVGPALVTPLARLLGLRVVVTHHGADYEREKWGIFARMILRLGEAWGMKFANQRIAISRTIAEHVAAAHQVCATLVPNGVDVAVPPATDAVLREFGLERQRYVLNVSRLVPEKRQVDLVRAFGLANINSWKLVLVGAADHGTSYSRELANIVHNTPNAMAVGFQAGRRLAELYSNAGVFVLPSSHEGLPIVLLEAMKYGLPVVASDIPANREVKLGDVHYFPVGNTEALASRIRLFSKQAQDSKGCAFDYGTLLEDYDWRSIATRTLGIYHAALRTYGGRRCGLS